MNKAVRILMHLVAMAYIFVVVDILRYVFIHPMTRFSIGEPHRLISGVETMLGVLSFIYLASRVWQIIKENSWTK